MLSRLFLILSIALVPKIAHSAATATTDTTYEIEALVFENLLPPLEGGELWTRDTVKPLGEAVTQAITVASAPADAAFASAAAQLAKSGQFRLLTHKRWLQSAEPKSTSQPARISTDTGDLDGFLRFYLSRYLHVELELAFAKSEATPENAASGTATNRLYRLSQQRRIKSEELHYFDHPKLGALVRIAPVKTPAN